MLCKKIFTAVIIVLAIGLGVLASALPPEHIESIFVISKFFEVMLPVLAAGALIKYLYVCPSKCPTCNQKEGGCNSK